MPLLYADNASELDQEKAVKGCVWSAVDGFSDGAWALGWDDLSKSLQVAVATLRSAVAESSDTAGKHSGPAKEADPPPRPPSPVSSSSSTSSSSSSSEGQAVLPYAEWAHGEAPACKVHILLADGRLPPCAGKVTPTAYGFGVAGIQHTGRKVCDRCRRRFGVDGSFFE